MLCLIIDTFVSLNIIYEQKRASQKVQPMSHFQKTKDNINFCYYGSTEWSTYEFLRYGMEDGIKKNFGMEYVKIIFHSIPFHALDIYTNTTSMRSRVVVRKSIARIKNIPRGVQLYFTYSSNVKCNIVNCIMYDVTFPQ